VRVICVNIPLRALGEVTNLGRDVEPRERRPSDVPVGLLVTLLCFFFLRPSAGPLAVISRLGFVEEGRRAARRVFRRKLYLAVCRFRQPGVT
jgi:hypothetical protein